MPFFFRNFPQLTVKEYNLIKNIEFEPIDLKLKNAERKKHRRGMAQGVKERVLLLFHAVQLPFFFLALAVFLRCSLVMFLLLKATENTA